MVRTVHRRFNQIAINRKGLFIMPNYRRSKTQGGTFFFTVVSYNRQKIFTLPYFRSCLRESIHEVRKTQNFDINAWVLLPDHLHCIWTLPQNDNDYSKRWGRIKALVSKNMIKVNQGVGCALRTDISPVKESRLARNESHVWQRRFWEHKIRDEADYNKHMDYIHNNPVKHGLVEAVKDWKYSSFHRHVTLGSYPKNWASVGQYESGFGE